LKVTPTALNSLRSLPSQVGHSVSDTSVNDCWMSNAVSQTVHLYEYVGMVVSSWLFEAVCRVDVLKVRGC
jgi:hypothetical protein